MAGEFLPPVVISIAVNDAPALAQLAGLKGAMAETSASIGGSAGKVGKDLEGMGAGATMGVGGIKTAEKDAESASKGFSGRMAMMFESLGNSMSSFGMPFGNSVKKLGYSMKEGESAAKGFGSTLLGVGKIAAVAGLAIVAGVAVAAVKAADQFDVAQTRLKQAVQDTGKSFATFEPQILRTEKAGTNFGFTMTETASSLAKLTIATKDPTKATADMGLAMDLSRMKGVSLETATQGLVKLYGGSTRALMQMGIQLDIGSMKLTALKKATEAVKTAKAALKAAEENMVIAQKKGEEEHAKAIEKVTAAQETLTHAQSALSADSGTLTAAQESLKTAQKGVAEAAEKQKTAIKEASAALKTAEQSARETAEAGAKGIEGAKKNLGNLETERAKESNEASIKTIEGEEKAAEAAGASGAATLAALRAKKAGLEATDKGIEATKKEAAVQEAHKSVIEAEAAAHKGNTKAVSAVTKAHDVLIQKQKMAMASSKENVTATNALATAHRSLIAAEAKLSNDQGVVAKDTRALSVAQEAASAPPKALALAQQKLSKAHEALSKAEKTAQKDSLATGEVLKYLAKISSGQAAAATHTLAGQWDILKAKWNESQITLGQKLMPTLLGLIPVMTKLVGPISALIAFTGKLVAMEVDGWTKIGQRLGQFYYGTLQPIVKGIVHFFEMWIGAGVKVTLFFVHMDLAISKVFQKIGESIARVVGFFVGMGVKIISAAAGIISDMVSFGAHIVEAIVHGITSAPGAIINAIKGLIPGGGLVGDVGKVLGLAKGGIVTKPTLAVVGEAGPEMVVPLTGIATDGVKPLGAQGQQGQQQSASGLSSTSGGLHIDNLTVNGMSTPSPVVVSELYSRLRPLLV